MICLQSESKQIVSLCPVKASGDTVTEVKVAIPDDDEQESGRYLTPLKLTAGVVEL